MPLPGAGIGMQDFKDKVDFATRVWFFARPPCPVRRRSRPRPDERRRIAPVTSTARGALDEDKMAQWTAGRDAWAGLHHRGDVPKAKRKTSDSLEHNVTWMGPSTHILTYSILHLLT